MEAKIGYTNRAASGGLDRYVKHWAGKGREICRDSALRSAFVRLGQTFTNYSSKSKAERGKRVKRALDLVGAVKEGARAMGEEARASEDTRGIGDATGERLPDWLKTPVQYVKGVGPKRAQILARIGIETLSDLLYYFPRRYEDRSHLKPISQVQMGTVETIKGEVLTSGIQKPRRQLEILKVAVGDGTGVIYGVWFNQSYLKKSFPQGATIILSGRVDRLRELRIVNPAYEILTGNEEDLIHTGRIVPIYSLTEKLTQRWLRSMVKKAVSEYAGQLPDMLSPQIQRRYSLINLPGAIGSIHFPQSEEDKEKARRRLVFDEFFLLQLGLALSKRRKTADKGIKHRAKGELFQKAKEYLPFQLTSAQEKVIEEVRADMEREVPMNRLLQGDVGSGKTVVAISALLRAVEGGFQAALMVPTEILAGQHFLTLQRWLLPLGLKVTLLIRSIGPKMKAQAGEEIESGQADIIVGTHALIQERVKFPKLGLIVIDEQHRFGVRQRATLRRKGLKPDVLVMTATPIPRTLALTVYGDLDISTIDELPPGRRPVATYWAEERNRRGVYKFIEEQVKEGRQAYIVCPLIDSERGEKLEVKAATQMAEHFRKSIFPHLRIGLLHGRMKGEEKERVMQSFNYKRIDILVSTTVIEVGIDVPNASIMLIEEADRFGLAQLHQLRGRVGRGDYQSYCIMIGRAASEEARRRLQVMTETTDGFRIAEEDLELRGPGEFFGTKQSGFPELRIGNIVSDMKLMELARQEALSLMKGDPRLEKCEHRLIKHNLINRFKGKLALISTG
ncbi:ATP-dependent DNA helicase RecG [candidate division NPL-UPA2 bacterium]|nr:ATP-dependent DNA helicase RecG [candidate division NPL-UPA2 bacterium]